MVGVPIHRLAQPDRLVDPRIPRGVVRVRDQGIVVEAVHEQPELVVRVEVEGAYQAGHAAIDRPLPNRSQERPRDLFVVDELEESEERCAGLVILIDRIDADGDRAHVATVPAGDEVGDLGDFEIGILGGVEEALALEVERRDPVGLVGVDVEPGLDEAFRLSRQRDRRHFD